MLREDASEHRKGRNRHRHRHEEGERGVADVGGENLVERQRDEEAERHGECDARVRDEGGLCDALAQDPRIQLHPDEEEVEGETDRGSRGEQGDDVGREEVVLGVRPDGAEQRGPEQDPGEHLPHHARLAEAGDDRSDEPGRQDDSCDREHEPTEGLLVRALWRRFRGSTRRRQRLGVPRGDALAADRPHELRRGALTLDGEVCGRRPAAHARHVARELPALEAELALWAVRKVDELTRLVDLELGAEAFRCRRVEAADRRGWMLIATGQDRGGGGHGEDPGDHDVAGHETRPAEAALRTQTPPMVNRL